MSISKTSTMIATELRILELDLRIATAQSEQLKPMHQRLQGILAVASIPCAAGQWQVTEWGGASLMGDKFALLQSDTDRMLLDSEGRVQKFPSRQVAEAEMDRLNSDIPAAPYRPASDETPSPPVPTP
jgi:hypothetical protein